MQAMQVREYGDSEVLSMGEAPLPQPGSGEALVKLSHAGINFIDIYMRKGVYRNSHTYQNQPPFTPGMEGGGVVEAVGDGVENVQPGDRVAYCLSLGPWFRRGGWRRFPTTCPCRLPSRSCCKATPRTTSRTRCFRLKRA